MIKNSLSWINLNASVGGGTGGTSDYNQLSNRPIKTLIGTVQNPIKLWKLETGLFILNGFIQHTNELVSEGKSLFVSVVAGLSNGKYVVAAFIPFWEGQYEYILNSLSSNNYNEHQIVMMISQDDVLTLDNEKEYTPTKDYHPSTKKYVDDMIVNFREELSEMGVNEENIESLMAENRRRDIAIQALLSQGGGSKTVTIEEETHTISLDYSIDKGMVTINTMEGSTLVNVATQKEKVGLSYGQANAVNYSNEILTEQNTNVKPMLEGNTMVNYCNNGNISMGLNKEINVVDDTGKMITLDDTVDNGLVDVKIEGKTLVNLIPKYFTTSDYWADNHFSVDESGYIIANANGQWRYLPKLKTNTVPQLKPNTMYTLIIDVKSNTLNGLFNFSSSMGTDFVFTDLINIEAKQSGMYLFKISTPNDIANKIYLFRTQLYNTCTEGSVSYKFALLEGDHTDKDLTFFEGLKSVGQDSEEISVASVNANLYPTDSINIDFDVNSKISIPANIKLKPNTEYCLNANTNFNTRNYIYLNSSEVKLDTFTHNGFYNYTRANGVLYQSVRLPFRFMTDNNNTYFTYISDNNGGTEKGKVLTDITLTSCTTPIEYQPHKSNKKQILYYNTTTQTWEKPVLREWDSIEKHSNGKYYYHKRSGEVVLNGSESESWLDFSPQTTNVFKSKIKIIDAKANTSIICDKIKYEPNLSTSSKDFEFCTLDGNKDFVLSISTSKASTKELFKAWLQANPVTLVYQLTQEEIYECTNLSLDTYSNQTNIFNNSLIPCNMEIKNSTYDCILFPNTKYTVKLDSNISNDIQVNLGGTVSTINSNIFEIITPNELTNESLTLYGNGEIVNNVMLFHNQDDITTYEYFTGLKSCFEEELVTDENSSYYGKYRVKYDSGVDSRTFYLNSPLLKGDRIEEKDGKLYHYHKMGKIVLNGSENWRVGGWTNDSRVELYGIDLGLSCVKDLGVCDKLKIKPALDSISSAYVDCITIGTNTLSVYISSSKLASNSFTGGKQWLQANPTTVVYELAEPYYEEISSSQKLIKSSSNNKLTFNTNIPLTSIQLKPYEEELTYLYKSTVYTVQFEADNNCLVNVTLGGTKLLNQSIVAGLNKIQITTPSTLLDNKLRLDVIGSCNISELVVTNSIQEFEYFEGMKSSFEDTPNDEVYNAEIIIYNAPVRFGKGGRL